MTYGRSIVVLASLVAAHLVAPAHAEPQFEKYQLVLLRAVKDAPRVSTAEEEKLQAAHLGHLKKMALAGKLVVAGPFDDQPDPSLRGLCLYRAGSLDEARRLAEDDPKVRAGRLRVEALTWYTEKGALAFPLFNSYQEAQRPATDTGAAPTLELPAPLARVLTDYEHFWTRRDAAGLAHLFAEDGYVLSSGHPPVKGRAAIERLYTGRGGPLALRAIAFNTEGNTGYIIGGFATERGHADAGKFTLTLRRDAAGRWWIVSDMDNGNSWP